MYRNRWVYAYCNALISLAINLITRAIWWSDEPLFSWNVPVTLILGYAIGHLLWPLFERMNRSHQARMAALKAKHEDMLKLIEEARDATSNRHYSEAMAKIDSFLNHPETGVQRKRGRSDHNPETDGPSIDTIKDN